MAELSEEQKKRIIESLDRAGAKNACPRCNNPQFSLIGGYFNQTVQNELSGLVIGGPSIPSVVAVCTRCGFMSQHALGVLGLLKGDKK